MDTQTSPFPRGVSLTSIPDGLLGMEKTFPDVNFAASSQVKPRLSGMGVKCRLLYNGSGGALLPAQTGKYLASYWGQHAGAVAGSLETPAYVVDEYLPAAGVPAGSYFWGVIEGPTKLITNGAGVIAQDDIIVTAASGKTVEQTAAPTQGNELAQVVNVCGRAIEGVAATADLKYRVYFKPAV